MLGLGLGVVRVRIRVRIRVKGAFFVPQIINVQLESYMCWCNPSIT